MTAAVTTIRGRGSVTGGGFEGITDTSAAQRAFTTSRFPRGAECRAEIHQCLIEVEDVADRQYGPRHVPQVPFHAVRLGIPLAHEDTKEHTRHVGVENGLALTERKAENG